MISEERIREFIKEFQLASDTKDFSNVSSMIHPNAIFRFNDRDYKGIENIKGAFESTWSYDVENEEYNMINLEIINMDSSSATLTFDFKWKGISNQEEFSIKGRGTQVLVLVEDKLKIILEHLSR